MLFIFEDDFIEGIEIVELLFGLLVKWISELVKDEVDMFGYIVVDFVLVVLIYIMEKIKQYVYELIGRQEMK